MWISYQLPPILLTFLDDIDLGTLSCVSRQLHKDTQLELVFRKRQMISHVMKYFHHHHVTMFSLHRTFQDDFLLNIRRLFQFIPEWFQYITDHNIAYLDISIMEPRLHPSMKLYNVLSDYNIPLLIESILANISQNTTLLYCNFNLFCDILTQDQVYEAVRHHPTLDHVELTMSLGYYSPTIPMALYRMPDRSFEWRHYPPAN